jgi:hypothetical protein
LNSSEAASDGEAERNAKDVGQPVQHGNIPSGRKALGLFIQSPEERAGYSESSRWERESAENISKSPIEADMEDFVVWHGEKLARLLDPGGGKSRETEDKAKIKDGGKQVFPSQLFHKKGILGGR